MVIEAIAVGEGVSERRGREPTEEELADLDRLRVRLTPAATQAFIARAKRVVSAGRPPCPLCGHRWTRPAPLPAPQRLPPVARLDRATPLAAADPAPPQAADDRCGCCADGELELEGRLVDASNTTLRAVITLDGVTARCVYKPVRGERPLWDFPDGTLAGREVAAYVVSAATGWDVVPPTVLRDGPLGEGACQLWIDEPDDADPLVGLRARRELPPGWLRVAAARDDDGRPYLLAHADDPRLARMALFDVVVNNADRKGGHVLHRPADTVYGVDHGVCFHVEDKLRTVLWGWAGRPLPADDAGSAGARCAEHLAGAAGRARCAGPDRRRGRRDRGPGSTSCSPPGRFPQPPEDRHAMPWPPI